MRVPFRSQPRSHEPDPGLSAAGLKAPLPASGRGYFQDAPLTDPDQDRFGRWPFARRVADTIASRPFSGSLVVALYGAWGTGKTTVLSYLRRELDADHNVICLQFNPWRYGDESTLIKQFFTTLARGISQSPSQKGVDIRRLVDEYSDVLAAFSVNLGLVQFRPADLRNRATIDLDERKSRISDALSQSKHLVILIDDVDRLDKSEIHSLFKVLKISADFPNTTYVVACDEDMVSAALAERYGGPGIESGRSFLEKIVQVPLHLPPPERGVLQQFCFEGVSEALDLAGIQLIESQSQEFALRFIDGLEPALTTPRMARRYANALMFVLPLLKGEVNIVELLLIEGMRVFYPAVYRFVREHPTIFLAEGTALLPDAGGQKQTAEKALASAVVALSPDAADAVNQLIKRLFPRFEGLLNGTTYGSSYDISWAAEQRVASRNYFDRFFSYGIPTGDVSDERVAEFIRDCSSASQDAILRGLGQLVNDKTAEAAVRKLRSASKSLPEEVAWQLALALGASGKLFPTPPYRSPYGSPFMLAAVLVSELVGRVSEVTNRRRLAEAVVAGAEPLPFAQECFHWLTLAKNTGVPDPANLFSEADQNAIGTVLAERIRKTAEATETPIYITYGAEAPTLLYVWAKYLGKSETTRYVDRTMTGQPRDALALVKAFAHSVWISSMSGGGTRVDMTFGPKSYDFLRKVAEPDSLVVTIRKLLQFPDSLPQPDPDWTEEARLAFEFVQVHREAQPDPAGSLAQPTADQAHTSTVKGRRRSSFAAKPETD